MKLRQRDWDIDGKDHRQGRTNNMADEAGRGRASGFAVAGSNRALAFTLVETVIAVLLATMMLTALYTCFASGWSLIQITGQDLRATQILLQRMERVRLCDFTQIKDTGLNPSSSVEYFDPKDQGTGGGGVAYTVTFASTTPSSGSLPEAYRMNMLLVTVGTCWTNGTRVYNRSMQTYVAKDGMQSYVSGGQ
jgi:hypothetical protein